MADHPVCTATGDHWLVQCSGGPAVQHCSEHLDTSPLSHHNPSLSQTAADYSKGAKAQLHTLIPSILRVATDTITPVSARMEVLLPLMC